MIYQNLLMKKLEVAVNYNSINNLEIGRAMSKCNYNLTNNLDIGGSDIGGAICESGCSKFAFLHRLDPFKHKLIYF